ncbi:hypothetical protein ACSXDM_15645 (plasmid) [Clostridium perfringens]
MMKIRFIAENDLDCKGSFTKGQVYGCFEKEDIFYFVMDNNLQESWEFCRYFEELKEEITK